MGFDKRFTCTIDIVETELYRSYSSFGVESLPFVRIYRVPSSISKYGSSLTFSIQRLLPITGFRSPRLPEKLNVRSRPSGKTFVKYAADEVRAPPDQMMVRIGPCPQTASWLATISWAAGGFFFPQSWSVSRLYTSHFREPAFVNMRLSLAALLFGSYVAAIPRERKECASTGENPLRRAQSAIILQFSHYLLLPEFVLDVTYRDVPLTPDATERACSKAYSVPRNEQRRLLPGACGNER